MGEVFAFEHKNYAPEFTSTYAGEAGTTGSISPVDLLDGSIVLAETSSDKTKVNEACIAPHTTFESNGYGEHGRSISKTSDIYCNTAAQRNLLLIEILPGFVITDVLVLARDYSNKSDIWIQGQHGDGNPQYADACALQADLWNVYNGAFGVHLGTVGGSVTPGLVCSGTHCTNARYMLIYSQEEKSFQSHGVHIMGYYDIPDCSTETISPLAAGGEPDDLSIPYGITGTTTAWDEFTTSISTATCPITYSIRGLDCSTCVNEATCDGGCSGNYDDHTVGSIASNQWTTVAVTTGTPMRWNIKIQGCLDTANCAESQPFQVIFEDSCPPQDCSAHPILDLPTADTPADIVVEFGVSGTITWPHFPTDVTATCGLQQDCRTAPIAYTIERVRCSTCSNWPSSCDGTCGTFTIISGTHSQHVFAGGTFVTDQVTDIDLMDEYQARISVCDGGCTDNDHFTGSTGDGASGAGEGYYCTDYALDGNDCGDYDYIFNPSLSATKPTFITSELCCRCGGGIQANCVYSDTFLWQDENPCLQHDCSVATVITANGPTEFQPVFGSPGTFSWQPFTTEHTADCAPNDCRDSITYQIFRFSCSECDDQWACLEAGDPNVLCGNANYGSPLGIAVGAVDQTALTFTSVPITSLDDIGRYRTLIQGYTGGNWVNSASFIWTDNAYSECDNPENEFWSWSKFYWDTEPDSTTMLPIQLIPFNAATQSVQSNFFDWHVSRVCEYNCPLHPWPIDCGPTTYEMICRENGTTDPFTLPTLYSVTLDPTVGDPNEFHANALMDTLTEVNGIPSVDIVFECYVQVTWQDSLGAKLGSSDNADHVLIQFDRCVVPDAEYCEYVTHVDLASGPDELIIDIGSTATSSVYNPFTDNLTTECPLDCHQELIHTVEWIDCNTCNNPVVPCCTCDSVTETCTDWVDSLSTVNYNSGDKEYTFTTPVQSTTQDKTSLVGRIKGVSEQSTPQTVYSEPFTILQNWQTQCSEAVLSDNVTTKPDFGGDIPWGTPGLQSTTHFEEFEDDICPEWCPLITAGSNPGCSGQIYEVKCKKVLPLPEDLTYEDPDTTYGFTANIDAYVTPWNTPSTQAAWATAPRKQFPVTIETTDVGVVGNTYDCHVHGYLKPTTLAQPIQATTEDFTVKFDVCGQVQFCSHVTHEDIPEDTFNPTGEILIFTKGVEYNSGNQILGFPFPPFKDSITDDCTVANDCHEELDYAFNSYSCTACTDPADQIVCEGPSCAWNVYGPNLNIQPLPVPGDPNSLYQLVVGATGTWGPHTTLAHKKLQITGTKATTGEVFTSPPFWLKIDAHDSDCGNAQLADASSSNKPEFTRAEGIPFGMPVNVAEVGFTEFDNNICPYFCPTAGKESCDAAAYTIECDEEQKGVNYVESTLFTATVTVVAPATDPPTYNVEISSLNKDVIGPLPGDINFEWQCRVKGTLNTLTAISDDFTVKFDPCERPDESCPFNTWEDKVDDDTSWQPPEPLEFEVFTFSEEVFFVHEAWQDWFQQYCGVDICGFQTYTWKYDHPDTDVFPLNLNFTSDTTFDTVSLKMTTNDMSLIGEHKLKLYGENLFPSIPSYSLTNEWSSLNVTVRDPCLRAYYLTQEAEDKPEDLSVEILMGIKTTTEWAFSNDVYDFLLEEFGEEEMTALGYEFPLCGYPTEYMVIDPDDETQIEECTATAEIDEQSVPIPGMPTGVVRVDCSTTEVTNGNWTRSATVRAWRKEEDENGNLIDFGHGLGKTFQIFFWKSPLVTIEVASNNPPDILNVPDEQEFALELLVDQTWTINVEDDLTEPVVIIDLGMASSFITYTNSSGICKFFLDSAKAKSTGASGNFIITITAQDDIQSTQSTFTIIITKEETEEEVFTFEQQFGELELEVPLDELEPLDVWIESISSSGLMEIRYSAPVVPIQNITNVTDKDYYLVFEQFSDEPDQTKEFRWELTKFHYEYTLTQLNFSAPLQVSQGDVLDQLTVYMRSELFMVRDLYGFWKNFTDEEEEEVSVTNSTNPTDPLSETLDSPLSRRRQNRNRLLEEIDYTNEELFVKLVGQVPNQIDASEAELLAGQASTAETVLSGVFWIPLLIQIVMSGAMAHVWNIMNTLQIVNTFPLYQVKVPENVIQMQLAFQQFSNVQIIPKDDLYDWIMEYMTDPVEPIETDDLAIEAPDEEEIAEGEIEEQIVEEINQAPTLTKAEKTASDFGMDTGKILRGAMQLVAGAVILAIVTFIVYVLDTCLIMYFPHIVQKFYATLKMKVFWNSVLRALIEQYLPTCMATFKSIQSGNQWNNFENVANSLASFIFIPYIVLYPIFIILFLRRNRFLLSDRKFMGKYGSLYLNVDYFKFGGLPFTAILIFRRCLFAFNAIFLADLGYSALIQLQVSLWASQAICQYLVRVKPMIDLPNNTAQIFNEMSILFFCIMMHNFTDYIPDPDQRYVIGWYFLYILYFVIGVNVCVIVILITKQIATNQMRKHQLKKQKARLDAIEKHNSYVDKIMKGKSKKEKKPHYMRDKSHSSLSISSNEGSINVDNIGREKKIKEKVERTFLQKRKDAKENFELKMKRMHDQDKKMQKDLDMIAVQQNKNYGTVIPDIQRFEVRKVAQDSKTLATQAVEPWEEQMWNDIAMDPSGNVIKFKAPGKVADAAEEEKDWEVVSSPSVRERRRLQQNTDWPLSARGHDERNEIINRNKNRMNKNAFNNGKDADSQQWSWDNENAGSDISEWMGLPQDYQLPPDQIRDFIDESAQDSFFGKQEPDEQILNIQDLHLKEENKRGHVGRTYNRAQVQPNRDLMKNRQANPQQSSQFSSLSSPSMSDSFSIGGSVRSNARREREENKVKSYRPSFSITDSSLDGIIGRENSKKFTSVIRPNESLMKKQQQPHANQRVIHNDNTVIEIFDYENPNRF